MGKKQETNISLINIGALVWLLFALSFCGSPDMHDKMLEYMDAKIKKEQQGK